MIKNETLLKYYTKEIKKETDTYYKNACRYIDESESTMERNLTNTRLYQYKNGSISLDKAREYAKERRLKELKKYETGNISKLENAINSDEIKSISVSIIWNRHRVWGYNPTATVTAETKSGKIIITSDSASGCGYDKRSAATAGAFNKINGLLKELYILKYRNNKAKKENPYGMNADHSSALPHFEGGVGFSCHENILKKCGFKETRSNGTSTTDFYYFER